MRSAKNRVDGAQGKSGQGVAEGSGRESVPAGASHVQVSDELSSVLQGPGVMALGSVGTAGRSPALSADLQIIASSFLVSLAPSIKIQNIRSTYEPTAARTFP